MKPLIIALALVSLTACSLFQRHPRSGYNYASGDSAYEVSLADLNTGNYLTQDERYIHEAGTVLKHLEKNLRTFEEKAQYNKYRHLMSQQEKIGFLKQPDLYNREKWLQTNGFYGDYKGFGRDIAALIEKEDIGVGMPMNAVVESWGEPELREFAGETQSGNQRWTYQKAVSTSQGYQTETRIVFFEGGRVVGWQKD